MVGGAGTVKRDYPQAARVGVEGGDAGMGVWAVWMWASEVGAVALGPQAYAWGSGGGVFGVGVDVGGRAKKPRACARGSGGGGVRCGPTL